MDIRRRGVPDGRLPGGDALVDLGLHFHVDLGRSLSGGAEATALRNDPNQDEVNVALPARWTGGPLTGTVHR